MTTPSSPDSYARTLTFTEVHEWINTLTDVGVDEVLAALQARHDDLHAERDDWAVVGRVVMINDVRPKYLQGLTGEIVDADDEGYVSILLDCDSTGRLRFAKQTRFNVGAAQNYTLENIPASCCYDPSPEEVAAGDQATA